MRLEHTASPIRDRLLRLNAVCKDHHCTEVSSVLLKKRIHIAGLVSRHNPLEEIRS